MVSTSGGHPALYCGYWKSGWGSPAGFLGGLAGKVYRRLIWLFLSRNGIRDWSRGSFCLEVCFDSRRWWTISSNKNYLRGWKPPGESWYTLFLPSARKTGNLSDQLHPQPSPPLHDCCLGCPLKAFSLLRALIIPIWGVLRSSQVHRASWVVILQ